MLWIMSTLHVLSVLRPLDRPQSAARVATALRRAEAMGLLATPQGPVEHLDLAGLSELLRPVADAGIARQPLADLAAAGDSVPRVSRALDRLIDALDVSPRPEREWERVESVLGPELLAGLLHLSESSLRRYRAGARATPDDVAGRLHFLALLISDLAGAYNDLGIRRWFERPRTRLGGVSPRGLLAEGWSEHGPAAEELRRLAESLVAAPAT
jgi:hypothetical protein